MKLYIANEIIKSQTIDRTIYNPSNNEQIGYFAFTSYYISKRLVLIQKNEDGTYTYEDGTICNIIKPKTLKTSHDKIESEESALTDTIIGVANLRPLKKITKKSDIEKIREIIEEYNQVIGDRIIYVDKDNYKIATSHLEIVTKKAKKDTKVRRRLIKKEAAKQTKESFINYLIEEQSKK